MKRKEQNLLDITISIVNIRKIQINLIKKTEKFRASQRNQENNLMKGLGNPLIF